MSHLFRCIIAKAAKKLDAAHFLKNWMLKLLLFEYTNVVSADFVSALPVNKTKWAN